MQKRCGGCAQKCQHGSEQEEISLATTKIWAIHGRIDRLIDYVANEDKTKADEAADALGKLIAYETNEHKTEQRLYVSGIGCTPENAVIQMRALLSNNDTTSDRVAYHAYQSFAEGEVDAETAHEIGIRFAAEMWGANFPVIVATHLNTSHYHNHFAVCATGFDGKRFHADGKNYHRMREVSDRLCRELGLSVIEQPKCGKSRYIGEVKAEADSRYSQRSFLRRQIDEVLNHTFTFQSFWREMEQCGYVLEYRGKNLRARADGGKHFIRFSSLGEGYSEDEIRYRLADNFRKRTFVKYESFKPPKEKATGFRALVLYYLYLLGEYPKKRTHDKKANALLKEDIRRARIYSEANDLMGSFCIETSEDLRRFSEQISAEFSSIAKERASLRNRLRRMHDSSAMRIIKTQISTLSEKMKKLRRQMFLCEVIALRSNVMEYVVNQIDSPEKQITPYKKERDDKDDEHIGRSCRSGHANGPERH